MNSLNLLQAIPPTRWLIRAMFRSRKKEDRVDFLGLKFPNKLGLAAGFDKDARYMHALSNIGFGFIEVGTVTPRPQEGNPKPRLFRLPKDEALINRMGFNNRGLDAMIEKLKARPRDVIIGGNIGKNKDTPNNQAVDDYLKCFNGLHAFVDYFVVNVSSPNTPGLRDLQEKGPLLEILNSLQKAAGRFEEQKPILLKIAPDLTEGQLDDIIEIVLESAIDGVIATNTSIGRNDLMTPLAELETIGNGGLSGKSVEEISTKVISYLSKKSEGRFKIIGVGGINDLESAQKKLKAGASLIQIYSGFVYEGPSVVKRIVKGLRRA